MVKIPFTNIEIKIAEGQIPGSRSRGKVRGLSSADPAHDDKGYKIDTFSLFVAWRNNGDIYSCVNKIKKTVMMGGFRWVDPTDPRMKKAAPTTIVNEIMEIINYQYGSFKIFKDKVFEQLLVAGNCYIEKIRNLDGRLMGLKILDARTIGIVSDQEGNIYHYVQSFYGGLQNINLYDNVIGIGLNAIADPVLFDPNDIIHFKIDTDPNAEVFGFSPMEPVLWEIRTDLAAMISNYFFFENDATPSIQYILEPDLGDDEKKKVLEFIKDQFRGPSKRHKAAVLDGIKEVKTISISQKDMEYLNGRQFTTEKICANYGVPKPLLGYSKDMTYNNVEGLQQDFYENTARGYEQSFQEMILIDVIGDSSLDYTGKIDLHIIPSSFETQQTLWDRAIAAREAGIATTDEARGMVGMEPLDQGEYGDLGGEIIIGTSSVPMLLEDVGTQDQDPEAVAADLKKKVSYLEKFNRNNARART